MIQSVNFSTSEQWAWLVRGLFWSKAKTLLLLSSVVSHKTNEKLTDDAILVELGNSAGYSEVEKPKFISGLRNVLQGLRQRKTKDFKIIASGIASFRARFLGDPSRILILDGVNV